MSEGIEYAEMLEIPVNTVNVVKKKKPWFSDWKELAVGKVNRRVESRSFSRRDDNFAGNSPVNPADALQDEEEMETQTLLQEPPVSEADGVLGQEGGLSFPKFKLEGNPVLIGEFAVACSLCAVIFLTNVFMPHSAINNFLRSVIQTVNPPVVDVKTYADFTLSPVVNEYADVTATVSSTGVLSFQAKCAVYPACDGTVTNVTGSEKEGFSIEVSHSDTFKSVYNGLSNVYYAVGESVKSNVPFAYSLGENAVGVSFYQDGQLLDCYSVDAENCLTWKE